MNTERGTTITYAPLPEDDFGATQGTVERMMGAALKDSQSPEIWRATAEALAGRSRDRMDQAMGIFDWVCSHVQFQYDEPALLAMGHQDERELLIHPAALITMPSPREDCDGFATLTAAMLLCAQIPCRIATIKADPDAPWRFSHVYLQARLENGEWLTMDCAQGVQNSFPCGWEAPRHFGKQAWATMTPAAPRYGLHGYEGLADFDFNNLIDQSFKLTSQILQKPGQYIQTAGGVMATQVPGAVPGQYPGTGFNVGGAGISTSTLLVGGGLLALVLVLGGRK